jgi:hypothetical protein
MSPLSTYRQQLQKNLATGAATEHTHRAALQELVESLKPDVTVINEPQRIECGAPDLAVLRDSLIVGHVEAKDLPVPLDQAERTDQLRRYLTSLENLILTNYLEFRVSY